MSRRAVSAIFLGLAALGLGSWWYFHRGAAVAESGEVQPTAHVSVAQIATVSMAQTVEAYGVIAPAPGAEQVRAAPYDCLVGTIYVATGTAVAAGDPLLQISPSPDSQLVLEAARSALVVADKALVATQERFDLKLATNQDLVVARQAQTDAKAKVSSLEARAPGRGGVIRAASAGVVSKIDVASGTLAPLGAPLVTVVTTRGAEARLEVEGGHRPELASNQVVTLYSADFPARKPTATRLRAVGAALNPASGSLTLHAAVPDGSLLLLGEHVRALIAVAKHPAALVVPRSAVLPDDGVQVLYTVKAGKAERHEVTLGYASDDQIEVIGAGLKAGDPVVVVGNYELKDGMAVQVDASGNLSDDAADKPGTDKTP